MLEELSHTNDQRPLAYNGLAENYHKYRPHYPDGLFEELNKRLPRRDRLKVADVGSGTGIFTRQLSQAITSVTDITGIELSHDMRKMARLQSKSFPNIAYVDGKAEQLPFEGKSIDLLTAATSVIWFDRRRFYGECERVLVNGGVLAIAMTTRDIEAPGLARDFEYLQEEFLPGFKPGTYMGFDGNYHDLDANTELSQRSSLKDIQTLLWTEERTLSWQEFWGLTCSRSDITKIVANFPREYVEARHQQIFSQWVDGHGNAAFRWIIELTTAIQTP